MKLINIFPVKTLSILSVLFVVACSDASTLEANAKAGKETIVLAIPLNQMMDTFLKGMCLPNLLNSI